MKVFPIPTALVDNPLGAPLLDKITRILAQQFCILSYNRARQRRKLVRSLDDWSILINEAEMVDSLIDQKQRERTKRGHIPENVTYWWSSWVVSQTFPLLRQYLQLGFELELYQHSEYPMIYWYLDYLLGMQIRTQIQMRDATKHYTGVPISSGARRPVADRRAGGRGKHAGARKEPTGPGSTLANLDFSARQLIVYAHHQLAQGLYRLLVAISAQQGRSLTDRTDGSEYGSLENRFFSRFGGFQRLTNPPALHPEHFVNLTNDLIKKYQGAEGIYKSAVDALHEAKAALEMAIAHTYPPPLNLVQDLKKLVHVTEGNLVTISSQLGSFNPSQTPTTALKAMHYDFSGHASYPVISFQDKEEKKSARRKKKKAGGKIEVKMSEAEGKQNDNGQTE